MIVLGLTGSIAMGKSTVSAMFRERGVPVWDADKEVHLSYSRGPEEIYKFVAEMAPECIAPDENIDRKILGEIVLNDETKLEALKQVLGHHLETSMAKFIADVRWKSDSPLAVLDVPLLFESRDRYIVKVCDYVACVYCSEEEQKRRAMARPGMTEQRFQQLLSRQMPALDKLSRADIPIDTGTDLEKVRARVDEIITNIADDLWHWTEQR